MRICVVGSGAMGSLYGGTLAKAGHHVDLVDAWPEHVDIINRDGFRMSGATGEFHLPLKASTDVRDFAGTADVVFLHTDTNSTRKAAESAGIALNADGFVLSLQNGIGNVEALSEVLGANRVCGGVSYHSATMSGPGHALHTNPGPTYVGEQDGSKSTRITALAEAMATAGFDPHVVDNLQGAIWTKFVLNCGVNALCAASGLRCGEMARNEGTSRLQDKILEEVMAVVSAKGIKLSIEDPIALVKHESLARYNIPSMMMHIQLGRKTEIDAINGALVREAEALGLSVPYNDALSMMIKGREQAAMQDASGVVFDYAALEAEAAREEAEG